MKTLTFPKTLEDYLSLNYSITFYPEREGGYTVVMQDLPGCISTNTKNNKAFISFSNKNKSSKKNTPKQPSPFHLARAPLTRAPKAFPTDKAKRFI